MVRVCRHTSYYTNLWKVIIIALTFLPTKCIHINFLNVPDRSTQYFSYQ